MPGVHASLDHIATAVVIVRIVVAVRVVSVVVIRVEAEAEAAPEVAIAIMKSTAAETTIAIVESTTIVEPAFPPPNLFSHPSFGLTSQDTHVSPLLAAQPARATSCVMSARRLSRSPPARPGQR
jgi:hypothetical protein